MLFKADVFLFALLLAVAARKERKLFFPYHEPVAVKPDGPCGDPLFLTPYLTSGELSKGRQLAKVPPLLGNLESYAGFLTVDQRFNSNMYFWFFPAAVNKHKAPFALWLQGGPGASSVYSVFTETGPYVVTTEQTLTFRSHYWPQEINVLYIDNPVGAGFSFTDSKDGYSTNETNVAENLYEALIQFFTLFPEYQQNKFYVTGESYAGKYIPSISYLIHQKNPTASLKINLKGLAIGDGFSDPYNMMVYSKYLYEIGLVDENGKRKIAKIESKIRSDIRKKHYVSAMDGFNDIFTIFDSYAQLGDNGVYNFVNDVTTGGDMDKYLTKHHVRKSLHVGDLAYWDVNNTAYNELKYDFMVSVKPKLEVLLDSGYRVVTYNGQLDVIVAFPLTENYLKKLKWNGAREYKTAARKVWQVNGVTAGYTKTVGNFSAILVRNAGHMVPGDQPLWALDLITRVTQDISF